MQIEYDKQADALYLWLSQKKQKVNKTKEISKDIMLDLNKEGNPIGLEIISVSKKLKPADLFNFSIKAVATEGVGA